jgi:hypothetical protein
VYRFAGLPLRSLDEGGLAARSLGEDGESMYGRRTFFRILGSCLFVFGVGAATAAQEHQHEAAAPAQEHTGHTMPEGSVFLSREASGTAWLPDGTPMYGVHLQARGWELMLHGNAFLQYLNEFAPEHRGAHQAGSINWFMAMAKRRVGAGRFGVRTMLSLEPWTVGGCGYPDLLATGELCDGDNIHDRQHPHDLFMEAAVEYDRPIGARLRWQIYGGPAGEPALGPVAFPHRLSAMPNPIAPITHHWFDATHIAYGVVTTGVDGAKWKAEGSVFNGREPDEARADFDFAALDSVSGRVSWLPTSSLSVQVSAGHLEGAEQPFTGATRIDIDRTTASATYHRGAPEGWLWATTAGWGSNLEVGRRTHGVLFESSVVRADRDAWFGRVEVNGKKAHDLHVHESDEVFTVGKVQAGYTRYFGAWQGLQPGIGGFVSAAFVSEFLQPRYGGVGTGIGLFLTVRPAAH